MGRPFFRTLLGVGPGSVLRPKQRPKSRVDTKGRSKRPLPTRFVSFRLELHSGSMAELTALSRDRGNTWSDWETRLVLSIWKEEGIQRMLDGTSRDSRVYGTIATKAIAKGLHRERIQSVAQLPYPLETCVICYHHIA